MDIEQTNEETPSTDGGFDFDSLVADVTSRLSEEDVTDEDDSPPSPDEDGPSAEEGELSTEESEDVEAEDDPQEEIEDQDPEQDPPEAEATVDPRDEEIEKLKEIVRSGQEQSQKLLDLISSVVVQQQQRQAQPQQPVDDLPDEVVKLALFGGDEDSWNKLDPTLQSKAKKVSQDYMERHTRYAKNPQAIYDDIRDRVLADLQQYVQPVLAQTESQRAEAIFKRHVGDLDVSTRERVAQIMSQDPRHKSLNPVEVEAALEVAARQARFEVKERQLAERERRVEAAERQKAANKKAAKRSAKRGSVRAPGKPRPKWEKTDDPVSYARKLQEQGIE